MDEKTCSACGGSGWFDDGTENDLSKKIGYRLRSRLYTMAYPVIIDGTDRRRMK